MELKIEGQARGTQILALSKAAKYRTVLEVLARLAQETGAEELVLPIVENASLYTPIASAICTFPDPSSADRLLCLRPDGTATCSVIAETVWKDRRDVRVFHISKCYRLQRPQLGHSREFTQFGYQILNPRVDYAEWMLGLAKRMLSGFSPQVSVNQTLVATYPYITGLGFSISCEYLGSEKQGLRGRVCVGGPFKQGYGFTMEVERVMLL